MDERARRELVETYFEAVDAESYEPFERVFSDSSQHIRPGQPALVGADEIRSFFETERVSSNSTHTIERWVDFVDGAFCKIHVEGDIGDERYEGEAIVELAFDDDTETIASYRVYRGYER
ncbi:MAG: nuclear transport factor 2 family protein [Salinirussus sp.]